MANPERADDIEPPEEIPSFICSVITITGSGRFCIAALWLSIFFQIDDFLSA
jgi:hypothetical protein